MTRNEIVQEAFRKFEGKTEYGITDCCQFAGYVYKEITGEDVMDSFAYASEEEAYQIIEEAGGWEPLLDKTLGDKRMVYAGFENGDPVLVNLPLIGEAMAVWFQGKPVVLTERRFVQVPLNFMIKGWRI